LECFHSNGIALFHKPDHPMLDWGLTILALKQTNLNTQYLSNID